MENLATMAILEFVLKITQVIGIPVAIVLYYVNQRKERLSREYNTYDELDDKYIDYLKVCLQNPDLDIADTPRAVAGEMTPDQQHRERMVFSILIAIMERAFLMYREKSETIREEQWSGWEDYIQDWCRRENFRAALPALRKQFDALFLQYLDSRMATAAQG